MVNFLDIDKFKFKNKTSKTQIVPGIEKYLLIILLFGYKFSLKCVEKEIIYTVHRVHFCLLLL